MSLDNIKGFALRPKRFYYHYYYITNLDYSRVEVAAAVVLHPESPSQQSRHRVRSVLPWGVNLAEFFLVTFKENVKKIGLSKNIVICRL